MVATCAAAAAGLTLAAGGSITQALISAALSFAQIPVKYGGLGIWDGVGNFVGQIAKQGVPQFLGEAATHAVVGGAISMAQGGSFASGAISGAVGAAGSEFAGAIGAGDFASRTAISAIAGGTASVLSGGKFANGAITAAFATMFNDLARQSTDANVRFEARQEQTTREFESAQFLRFGSAPPPSFFLLEDPPIIIDPPLAEFPKVPTEPPAEGYEWRGRPGSNPGSEDGNWFNPKTGESLRFDLDHKEPIGPHIDYKTPEGNWYRWFPDGRMELKQGNGSVNPKGASPKGYVTY